MLTYLGIRPDQQIFTFCGGGVAASVPFFALKFIADKRLDMTVFQNGGAQGRGAVQTALKLIKKENVPTFTAIPFEPVTFDNYKKYTK